MSRTLNRSNTAQRAPRFLHTDCELRNSATPPRSSSPEALDVLWLCPWPKGGAGSASRGVLCELRKRGYRTSYNPRPLPSVPVRCIVLLGLSVAIAREMRTTHPDALIVLQNHSPWLFLAWSQSDATRWHQCLAWARADGNAHVAQVAWAEFRSARTAYGPSAIDCLPAVYPYPIETTPAAPSNPPAVILAHRDRPWKSIPSQLIAAALAHRTQPLRVIYPPPPDQVTPVADIADLWNVPVHTGKWSSQDAFRTAIRTASVSMCATWAECYSQAALDALSQGVPVVAGPANWFVPTEWQAFPDDPAALAARILRILRDPDGARPRAILAAHAAQRRQLELLEQWLCRNLPAS